MFGLSLRCQLFQGPAVRTWNCVTNFANLLWYKFYHIGEPIMPRPRRRHHSRSRTRSRSNSLERARDPKRRKVESYEEDRKRSLSSEADPREATIIEEIPSKLDISKEASTNDSKSEIEIESSLLKSTTSQESDCDSDNPKSESKQIKLNSKVAASNKPLTPKQLQKKLESQKRREEKEKEREKLKHEREELKKKTHEEKDKEKREKHEQRQKELDEKQKEKEMREEKKKKEREEKDLKRKEKEEKIEQKRKEQEEKTKEKLKQEEKKQKVSNAFKSFFMKKSDSSEDRRGGDADSSIFMPFEVKSDMRLAPIIRTSLSDSQREDLMARLKEQDEKRTYLEELKLGKAIGKSSKTWVGEDDDVVLVECDLGESILEQSKTSSHKKAKFLKFDENRRPPYFGTWRKKSKFVTPRKPFSKDSDYFDYSVDSDDDWEEEDPGESLHGSDDEDKENESENEYDEDNDFLVPHGHLSDDEVNDEEDAVINPEDHKAKLKLLKKEFEDEMKEKTHRIKPRVVGCIWYNKNGDNVDEIIRDYLEPFSVISNGRVVIKKRSDLRLLTPMRASGHIPNPLSKDLIPEFLKYIHGSTTNAKTLVKEYLSLLKEKNINTDTSQKSLTKQMRNFAVWERCPEEGLMYKKFCWCVRNEVKEEYKVELTMN